MEGKVTDNVFRAFFVSPTCGFSGSFRAAQHPVSRCSPLPAADDDNPSRKSRKRGCGAVDSARTLTPSWRSSTTPSDSTGTTLLVPPLLVPCDVIRAYPGGSLVHIIACDASLHLLCNGRPAASLSIRGFFVHSVCYYPLLVCLPRSRSACVHFRILCLGPRRPILTVARHHPILTCKDSQHIRFDCCG